MDPGSTCHSHLSCLLLIQLLLGAENFRFAFVIIIVEPLDYLVIPKISLANL